MGRCVISVERNPTGHCEREARWTVALGGTAAVACCTQHAAMIEREQARWKLDVVRLPIGETG